MKRVTRYSHLGDFGIAERKSEILRVFIVSYATDTRLTGPELCKRTFYENNSTLATEMSRILIDTILVQVLGFRVPPFATLFERREIEFRRDQNVHRSLLLAIQRRDLIPK